MTELAREATHAAPVTTSEGDDGEVNISEMPTEAQQAMLEGVLAIVRRETFVLAAAMQSANEHAALLAETRLLWALAFAREFTLCSYGGLTHQYPRLAAAQAAADRWLPPRAHQLSPQGAQAVLRRALDSPNRLGPVDASDMLVHDLDLADLPLAGTKFRKATVAGITARGARLDMMNASEAQIRRSCFAGASLRLAGFDKAVVEDCDFSKANLEWTDWTDASVARCIATGAVFQDARFFQTKFIDCDFRDADFQAPFLGEPDTVRFDRCDLRDTCWSRRDLTRMAFIDCKLDGVHGDEINGIADVTIVRPELSPDADRANPKATPVARWGPNWVTR